MKYSLNMLEYHDKNGKRFKIHCQDVELLDNTLEHAGYWSAEMIKCKDFNLKVGDKSQFIFYTDQCIILVGQGTVQCEGQSGCSLIGIGRLRCFSY